MNRFARTLGFGLLLVICGCNQSSVRYDKTLKLEPNRPLTLNIDAPKKDQEVAIEVSGTQPFNVEVVLDEDIGKSKPLALKSDTTTFAKSVVIPASKPFSIIITPRSTKETQVTVKANSVD